MPAHQKWGCTCCNVSDFAEADSEIPKDKAIAQSNLQFFIANTD